jgi:hypothetical protein
LLHWEWARLPVFVNPGCATALPEDETDRNNPGNPLKSMRFDTLERTLFFVTRERDRQRQGPSLGLNSPRYAARRIRHAHNA